MSNFAQSISDGFLNFAPHVNALGLKFVAMGDDWAELALPYAAHLVAYPADNETDGIIASGAIFSLMDTVGGMAVIAKQRRLLHQATLDLRLDYLRPAEPGKTVTGHADVVKITRSVAFVSGFAHDGNPEHPLARMAATYMFTKGARA